MPDETPEIVEKDGSWSYRIGGMSFGSYPSREAALIASTKHEKESPEASDAPQSDAPRDLDNPSPS